MPFYEYQCDACGAHHEVLQKISDEPLKKCPDCGKSKLKRLISAPVFRLKGSGWYETDFKSEQERKRNLAGREEESASSDAKSESKTEAKSTPEPKSETKPAASKPAAKKSPARKAAKSARPSASAKPVKKKKAKA
jgi:putative FmdB family regulatory protein